MELEKNKFINKYYFNPNKNFFKTYADKGIFTSRPLKLKALFDAIC